MFENVAFPLREHTELPGSMIRGIVRICADLGITTIGEMIETREQADALRRIGVQLGQGWYFGRPSPEPEVPWDFAPSQFTFARA